MRKFFMQRVNPLNAALISAFVLTVTYGVSGSMPAWVDPILADALVCLASATSGLIAALVCTIGGWSIFDE